MSYCLSPHDRDVLEAACDERDWTLVRDLLAIDLARRARLAANAGWTGAERAVRDRGPFDRERDEGDAA